MILNALCLPFHVARSYTRFCYRTFRTFRTLWPNVNLEYLENRRLLKIYGPDSVSYLQSMVTNDIQQFINSESLKTCMYSLLLNLNGYVLYDTLVYKIEENEYFVEYDASATEYIIKHLTMYRLRKNVKIEKVKEFSVWVAFPSTEDTVTVEAAFSELASQIKTETSLLTVVKDPRSSYLGCRIIANNNSNVEQVLVKSNDNLSDVSYRLFRYKLGFGEGVIDHPPGSCLPFETNVDFLHGVSFRKGCYLGQELTARIHYTGVVRKRIMPVLLESESGSYPTFPVECPVLNHNGKKIGKFRSHIDKYGLAVLNCKESLKSESLTLENFSDYKIKTLKPKWWPDQIEEIGH